MVPSPHRAAIGRARWASTSARGRLDVGFLAHVPVDDAGELPEAGAPAGLGHALEAQVDAVGQERGEQRPPLAGRQPGLQVREAAGEAGPAIDLLEQVGDPDPGQHAIEELGNVSPAALAANPLPDRTGPFGVSGRPTLWSREVVCAIV